MTYGIVRCKVVWKSGWSSEPPLDNCGGLSNRQLCILVKVAEPTSVDTSSHINLPVCLADMDIVLQSIDGVTFRVRSELLYRASPWFRTMLTLPQTTPKTEPTEPDPIHMNESSSVLADLLHIIDGTELPPLDDADRIESLLAAADKYEVTMALSVARLALSSRYLNISPIRLFGIACGMSWEKEAQDAVARTLTTSLLSPEAQTELAALASAHRDKLLSLHRQRREELLAGLDHRDAFYANMLGGPCNAGDPSNPCTAPLDHSRWWALKYALLKRWDERPFGEGMDEGFYGMQEVWDMSDARCLKCERRIYGMESTVKNLNALVRKLPRTVQVGVCVAAVQNDALDTIQWP
ncbi:hypothetical protein C8Q78DRAFT_157435 [Trametes maxima]|nr:hypothetical protein C8Q78DRAFT_157435 [Trametes maxima]